MNRFGEAYYQLALAFFENQQYEESIVNFIKAYEFGFKQNEVLELIYECFILPNKKEFMENYDKNSKQITKVPYEQLLIDFIPVSDEKFYLFDKKKQKFIGGFEFGKIPEITQLEFHSLLIADEWDYREIQRHVQEKNWQTIYILLQGEQENYFASFLKLPEFAEKYLQNVILFNSIDLMKLFFETYSDYYLPKCVLSLDNEKYLNIINELHQKRIKDVGKQRGNVFLSICIPSYNRGSIALDSVKRILACEYDAEIQVVVSNNGSVKNVEGYQEIKNLQDSRVKYFEFKTNHGFPSNICKTINLADGQFIIWASDEDKMIIENLKDFLKCLYNHLDCGTVYSSGKGDNFCIYEDKYLVGEDSLLRALNSNYLTGICINKSVLNKNDILNKICVWQNNQFYIDYPHSTIMSLISINSNAYLSSCCLWVAGSSDEDNNQNEMLLYMWPENRIQQQFACIEIMKQSLDSEELFHEIVIERVYKTYYLLSLAYMDRTNSFIKKYSWLQACLYIHEHNLQLIEHFKLCGGYEKKVFEKIFWEYLGRHELIYTNDHLQNAILIQIAQEEYNKGEDVLKINFEKINGELQKMLINLENYKEEISDESSTIGGGIRNQNS